MKPKEIVQYNLVTFAAVLTFLFTLPVFSERPFIPPVHAGISAEFRPLFVQLAGQAAGQVAGQIAGQIVGQVAAQAAGQVAGQVAAQAETAGLYQIVHTAENTTPVKAMAVSAEAQSGLVRSAQAMEIALIYHVPATVTIPVFLQLSGLPG